MGVIDNVGGRGVRRVRRTGVAVGADPGGSVAWKSLAKTVQKAGKQKRRCDRSSWSSSDMSSSAGQHRVIAEDLGIGGLSRESIRDKPAKAKTI